MESIVKLTSIGPQKLNPIIEVVLKSARYNLWITYAFLLHTNIFTKISAGPVLSGDPWVGGQSQHANTIPFLSRNDLWQLFKIYIDIVREWTDISLHLKRYICRYQAPAKNYSSPFTWTYPQTDNYPPPDPWPSPRYSSSSVINQLLFLVCFLPSYMNNSITSFVHLIHLVFVFLALSMLGEFLFISFLLRLISFVGRGFFFSQSRTYFYLPFILSCLHILPNHYNIVSVK